MQDLIFAVGLLFFGGCIGYGIGERQAKKNGLDEAIIRTPPLDPPATREEYLERMDVGWNGFSRAVDAHAAMRRRDALRDVQKDIEQRAARRIK